MKQLRILSILLLLGVGIIGGLAAAELTASQSVPPFAPVGETVQLTVMLTYKGDNTAQAVVTPRLPSGVVTDVIEGQSVELQPGYVESIRHPIRAVQSGTYTVTSQIAYAEDGTWRELLLEAPFKAEGEIQPPPQEEFGISPDREKPAGGLSMGETPSDVVPLTNGNPSTSV